MPGPLPNPNRRRRNAPTAPSRTLPARGRREPAPAPPDSVELDACGRAWWAWAWSTPQAAGWSEGDVFAASRRASLEDDLAASAPVEALDVVEALGTETMRELRVLVRRRAARATARLGLFREMRELDDRLGLSPKGRALLRWEIIDDEPPGSSTTLPERGKRCGRAPNVAPLDIA